MRILLTRPLKDAERFAEHLVKAGHQALVSPVIRIEATGAAIPAGVFDGIVASSANAFAYADAALQRLAADKLPVYAVGEHTADAARGVGLTEIAAVAESAATLAESMKPLAGRKLLYLAGVDRKPHLEAQLRRSGAEVVVTEIYRASALTSLEPGVVAAFESGSVDAVVHFSRRSAALFAKLAAAEGIADTARTATHFCLSLDVAAGLAALAPGKAIWPGTPAATSLLALISEESSRQA